MKWLKKVRYVLILGLLFFLAGCFEINEEIEIKPGGSGELSVRTDMSQLLDMMQTYMGPDEMAKKLPARKLDTIIQVTSLVDSAKDLNGERKKLVKDGTVHLNLDLDQKLFKSDMKLPFSSQANLQTLYGAMNDQSLGMTSMSNLMMGSHQDSTAASPNDGPAPENAMGSGQMPDMSGFNGIYAFEAKDGSLSRKLDASKWKKLQENPQFAQMQTLQTMGISIPYTLTVHLPKAAKKVSNPLATLSTDKKTVTLKYNIAEVFQHPEKFEYSIIY